MSAEWSHAAVAPSPLLRGPVKEYLMKEKDDEVVLAFGRDYFHGARAGSGLGGLFTGAWAYIIYRRMKLDQHQANFEVGLKPGQPNPNFSSWVIPRGLRTQPMLTVGCLSLAATTVFKGVKCYLAHRRCIEFLLDDVEFAMLERMSRDDPVTRELFEKICAEGAAATSHAHQKLPGQPGAPGPSATQVYKSVELMMRDNPALTALNSGAGALKRPPTYWDGAAVGILGTIMDCYMPMKPVNRYYNMSFGMSW